jgi:lactate dehydrogenase-like 2-hydroxyacid dehydrogenase
MTDPAHTKKWNVFVTRQIPPAGIDLLNLHCGRVDVNPDDRTLSKKELIEAVQGKDGFICLITDILDRELLEAVKGVKIISNFGAGFDHIDLAAATRLSILVTNTPGVLTGATADLTWALIFAVSRRIVEADRFTRMGLFREWHPMLFLGGEISGRTLGIIGAGRIGSAVALKSRGFEMPVLYHDSKLNPELESATGARFVALDDLLRESDVVSLHVPLTSGTRRLIGGRELNLMKKTAVLINTSRGPVVDETALVRALQSGRIAGAGLDVYEHEPKLAPGLAGLENVVLLPHLGSATVETRTRMSLMAAENLISGLSGELPVHLVNKEVLNLRGKY